MKHRGFKGSTRPKLPGKDKAIYNREQTAFGSPFFNEKNQRGLLAAPAGWSGTDAEWLVYRTLTRSLGLKEGIDADFSYQSRLSTVGGLPGRLELGGLIADFLLPGRRLIIEALSEYYHYRSDLWSVTRERQNAAALAGQGYVTVWIDSDSLDHDALYYVREALEFRDHSRMATGLA